MTKSNPEWITQYFDFMRSGDLDKGMMLRQKNFPSSFFKYRQLNDFALESLEYKELWLADINSLNDPFECTLTLNNNESLRRYFSDKEFPQGFKKKFGYDIKPVEISEIVLSEAPYETYARICALKGIMLDISSEKQKEIVLTRWQEIINDSKKNIQICSFSERNDSLLMWSHYADKHYGICVEYDFEKTDEIRVFLQPVFYTDKIFQVEIMEDLNLVTNILASLSKSKEWEYEAEWRITFPNTDVIKTKLSAPVPKAVYLGARFHLNNEYKKKQLIRTCESQGIPIYQMAIHPTEYKITRSS